MARELGYDLPQEGDGQAPAYFERREHFVEVRGLRLCLSEWGSEKGPIVFCVHGILEQGAAWDPVAVILAERGYRVVAPDLRGHGLSGHVSASGTYQLLDFVADLDALTGARGREQRITLVGHSLGAVLAALLAGARPGRFGSLVLVEKPVPSGGPNRAALAPQLDLLASAAESSGYFTDPGGGGGADAPGHTGYERRSEGEHWPSGSRSGTATVWCGAGMHGCEQESASRNRGWRGRSICGNCAG